MSAITQVLWWIVDKLTFCYQFRWLCSRLPVHIVLTKARKIHWDLDTSWLSPRGHGWTHPKICSGIRMRKTGKKAGVDRRGKDCQFSHFLAAVVWFVESGASKRERKDGSGRPMGAAVWTHRLERHCWRRVRRRRKGTRRFEVRKVSQPFVNQLFVYMN